MSTIETLHQVVDQLPEEAQLDLIRYIAVKYDRALPPVSEDEQADTEVLTAQLMNQRYESYRKNPETAVSAEESRRRLLEKHGWR